MGVKKWTLKGQESRLERGQEAPKRDSGSTRIICEATFFSYNANFSYKMFVGWIFNTTFVGNKSILIDK